MTRTYVKNGSSSSTVLAGTESRDEIRLARYVAPDEDAKRGSVSAKRRVSASVYVREHAPTPFRERATRSGLFRISAQSADAYDALRHFYDDRAFDDATFSLLTTRSEKKHWRDRDGPRDWKSNLESLIRQVRPHLPLSYLTLFFMPAEKNLASD